MTKTKAINSTLVTLTFLFGTLFLVTLIAAVDAIQSAETYRKIADNASAQLTDSVERRIADSTPRTVIVDAETGDYVTCQSSYILYKAK